MSHPPMPSTSDQAPSSQAPTSSSAVKEGQLDSSGGETHQSVSGSFDGAGYTKELGRVGYPPLAPLPLDTLIISGGDDDDGDVFWDAATDKYLLKSDHDARHTFWEAVKDDDLQRIRQVYGITGRYDFCIRRTPAEHRSSGDDKGTETLFLEAPADTNRDNGWARFIDEVRRTLLLPAGYTDLTVEVVAEEMQGRQYHAPVEPQHPFCVLWENELRKPVVQILGEEQLAMHWHAIDVVRMSTSPISWSSESKKWISDANAEITILIGMAAEASDEQWLPAKYRIRALLDDAGFPEVKIAAEHSEWLL